MESSTEVTTGEEHVPRDLLTISDRLSRATMADVDYSQITYDVRGEVAVITLNRPERLNAWTPTMAEEQADAIRRAKPVPFRPVDLGRGGAPDRSRRPTGCH